MRFSFRKIRINFQLRSQFQRGYQIFSNTFIHLRPVSALETEPDVRLGRGSLGTRHQPVPVEQSSESCRTITDDKQEKMSYVFTWVIVLEPTKYRKTFLCSAEKTWWHILCLRTNRLGQHPLFVIAFILYPPESDNNTLFNGHTDLNEYSKWYDESTFQKQTSVNSKSNPLQFPLHVEMELKKNIIFSISLNFQWKYFEPFTNNFPLLDSIFN